jgi:hypothetical protein
MLQATILQMQDYFHNLKRRVNMTRNRLLLCITLTALLSGCSFNMGTLTAASTQNISLPHTTVKNAVEGKDCAKSVLFIPLGSLEPNVQEAADNALATAPGANALTDVVLYADPLILLLYNEVCLRVRGDAVKVDLAKGGSR